MIGYGLSICILFGLNASAVNIGNKYLITNYGFKTPLLLLFVQYFLTVVVIEFLRRRRFDFFPKFTWKGAKDSFCLSIAFLGNIVLSLYGMNFVNLPMYVTLRKLGTAIVFMIEIGLDKKPPSLLCSTGIILISLGAVFSGYHDLTSDSLGFVLIILANIMNALQLHLANDQKKQCKNLNPWDQPYYTALLSLPFVYAFIFCREEHIEFFSQYYSEDPSFYVLLVAVAMIGTLSNFTMFLCTTENSPMAVMITGNVKDVLVISVGLLYFRDVEPNFYFVSGLFISMVGACVYSIAQYMGSKERKQ